MNPKINDYSVLLNDLRFAYNNFFIDEYGIVSDNDNKEYRDQRLATTLRFSLLYCSCIKNLYDIKYGTNRIGPNDYIFQALTNIYIFNSFMNICILEYQMYDDIGTGKAIYYPCEQMADFFFNNPNNKTILKAYLDSEMDNIIQIQEGKEAKTLKKESSY